MPSSDVVVAATVHEVCPHGCGMVFDVQDAAHVPVVEAVHALTRCWEDLKA